MPFTPVTVSALAHDLYAATVDGNPVAWPAGAVNFTCKGEMSDADATDTANSAEFSVWGSWDNGLTYSLITGYTWQGGVDTLHGGGPLYPALASMYSANPPTHLKVRLGPVKPRPISAGAHIDFS